MLAFAGILLRLYFHFHGRWKEALGDRDSLPYYRPALENTSRRKQYRRLLSRALDGAGRFFGPPLSFRAFGVCLGIAFLYPLLFFLLTWVVSGSHTMGALALLPDDWRWWERGLFLVGFAAYFYIIYQLFLHHEAIGAWIDQNLARSFPRLSPRGRRLVRALGLGGVAGVITYGATGSMCSLRLQPGRLYWTSTP